MDPITLPQTYQEVDTLSDGRILEISRYLVDLFGQDDYHKIMDEYGGLHGFLKKHIDWKHKSEAEYARVQRENEQEMRNLEHMSTILRQKRIRLMIERGMSDEEIDAELEAGHDRGSDQGDHGPEPDGTGRAEDEVQEAQ